MCGTQTSCLGLLLATSISCGPVAADTSETTSNEWKEKPSEGDSSNRFASEEQANLQTGTSQVTPGPPSTVAARLNASQLAMLSRHNQHRVDHCAPPLLWSAELAAVAQSWADQLKGNSCAFEHSQNSPYGENLSFFAPVGSSTAEAVVTGWYSEVSEYDFSSPVFGMNTGHFTQVVWRGTTEVGCAQSRCNGGELWVCNYNPPGNMSGSFEQNVRPRGCAGQ